MLMLLTPNKLLTKEECIMEQVMVINEEKL